MDGALSPVNEMNFIKFTTPYVTRENDEAIPGYRGVQGAS
jgi:hypothetical protein